MNPYQNRAAIGKTEAFIGREREMRQIRECIEHGVCVSLVGERRMGKSSCLYILKLNHEIGHMDEDAEEIIDLKEYVCLFIDCQYLKDSTEAQVLRFILNKLAAACGSAPLDPTRESLRTAAERLSQHAARRLVLIFDEIDLLASSPNIPSGFFSFLRGWSQDFRIVFLIASKENSIEAVVWNENAGSPFWNIFKTLYIGPFSREEALWLIHEPSAQQSFPFSQSEERYLLQLGGHHPFFLQIACDHAFQLKTESRTGDISLDELKSRFRIEAKPHLSYLWRALSDPERESLIFFVREGTSIPERVLRELLKKGIILEDTEGPRVFCNTLHERIAEMATPTSRRTSRLSRAFSRYFE